MNKQFKNLCVLLSVLCLLSSCSSGNEAEQESFVYEEVSAEVTAKIETEKDFEEIVNTSAVCLIASTISVKEETVEHNGVYYTKVDVLDRSHKELPDEIIVVHKIEQLKKKPKKHFYIFFLNPINGTDTFYLNGGENAVIKVYGAKKDWKIEPLDDDNKKQIQKIIGKDNYAFLDWLNESFIPNTKPLENDEYVNIETTLSGHSDGT